MFRLVPVGVSFDCSFMERQITIHKKKKNKIFVFLLLELLQIMSAMSDSYPSVLSLHILLSAVFPYPGSCTSAKTDSYARPGNLQIN